MSSSSACRRTMALLAVCLLSSAARAASHDNLRYYSVNGIGLGASVQDTGRRSVALRWSVLPPTIGSGAPGAELSASISRRSESVTIQLNAAAGLSGERRLVSFGGVILEGPNRWIVRPISEIFVESDLFGATELSALIGAVYRICENLSANAGFRLSQLNQPDFSGNVAEVRAGLTWLF